jgi:hypothetical protein
MPFNVGDTVTNCGSLYVIVEVSQIGKVKVKREGHPAPYDGWYMESLFEFVSSDTPPTSVLTGMTQFFKDHKEKTNAT